MIAEYITNTFNGFKNNPASLTSDIIYQTITTAINNYITKLMKSAIYIASGTTTVGVVTTPFVARCVQPLNPLYLMPVTNVSSAFKTDNGELCWPILFKNIGEYFRINYIQWQCIPEIIAYPEAIINTMHFYSIGEEFYKALHMLNSKILFESDIDPATRIWSMFETYLHKAIITTPPSTLFVSGFVGGAVFTGESIVAFNTLFI